MNPVFIAIAVGVLLILIAIHLVKGKLVRTLCRMGAAKIYRQIRSVYEGEHKFEAASRADFQEQELDWSAYDEIATVALDKGGVQIGGFENLTVSEVHPENRTLLETYSIAQGKAAIATYQIDGQQFTDVITELKDGRFVVTTNAELDKLTTPSTVDKHTMPVGTPLATLLTAHGDTMNRLLDAEPGVQLVLFESADDVIASNRRYSLIASEHRKSVGYLTKDELVAIAENDDTDNKLTEMLWKEFVAVSAAAEGKKAA